MSEKKVGKKSRAKATKNDSFIRKLKRNQKSLLLMGISFVALVIVVTIIVVASRKSVESDYFHDSENKIVLTMDRDVASIEKSIYEPYITHMVYYYNGDTITGLNAYYEYESEDVAKEVYDHLDPNDFAIGKRRDGRFVVFEVDRSKYEDVTVEEILEERELLKQIDALILDYDENTLGKYGKWIMPIQEEDAE